MPEIAGVLVSADRAGEPERVVAADRVLHDLDERIAVAIEELREQAGLRVGEPGHRARRRRVEAEHGSFVERAAVEGEEVRALAARDVDDLDVLALEDLEALGARDVDADVETRLGERLGQARLAGRGGTCAADEDQHVARRCLVPDQHRLGGRGDDDDDRALGLQHRSLAGRCVLAEELGGGDAADIELAAEEAEPDARGILAVAGEDALYPGRLATALETQRRKIAAAVLSERGDLDRLAALEKGDLDRVVPLEGEHGRAAAFHDVAFNANLERRAALGDDRGPPRRGDCCALHRPCSSHLSRRRRYSAAAAFLPG